MQLTLTTKKTASRVCRKNSDFVSITIEFSAISKYSIQGFKRAN